MVPIVWTPKQNASNIESGRALATPPPQKYAAAKTAIAVVLAGIDRQTPLGALLPEARGTASEQIPIELLLSHRAGLDAHRSLFAPLLRGEAVDIAAALREAAGARRLDAQGEPPAEGVAPPYSELGDGLAGEAPARATGARDAGQPSAAVPL